MGETMHDSENEALLVIETVTVIQTGFLLSAVGLGSLIMGSKVTPDDFTQCVKKPTALWLTMLAVVFVAPLTAYILTLSLQLHFSTGVTLLITSCCPADILSPIFAYYTNADICLCLTVFVLSTAMSVGLIPLGVFFCSAAFTQLNLAHIPHDTVIVILIGSMCGLTIGMLFRKYQEKWADCFVRVFSSAPIVLIVTMVVIDGVLLPHSFQASNVETLSVLIYLLTIFAGTYIIGLLAGQGHETCRAMTFCAANKSALLVLTIVHNSYAGHVIVGALPVPTLLLILYIALGISLSATYHIYTFFKNRA